MTLARVAIFAAKGAALALIAFGFFVVSLRYVHHLPLPTSRTVEIAGGRLALEVPRPWIVSYSTTAPHDLAIEHRALPVWATISLRWDANAAGMDPVSMLRARGLAASAQGRGRAVASVAHDAGGLAASHHLAVMDRRGRLMHLQVDVGHAPRVASEADSYRSIVRFIDTRLEWLREHTGLAWRRAPTHTGLRAILLGLDQAAVERALRRRSAQALAAVAKGDIVTVAIDSKALRGSLDRFANKAALQWLSAFATGPRLVLGQVGWDSGAKGGETRRRTGADRGSRPPGQALHARRAALPKKTLQAALASGSDALVQVKGNQPTLLHDITVLAAQTQPQSSHHEDQLGQRNRIETRCTSVWPVAAGRLGADWSAVACVIEVRRHTEVFNTRLGTWQPRSQTAYYICTREISALQAHRAV